MIWRNVPVPNASIIIIPVFFQNLTAAELLLQTPVLNNICHLPLPVSQNKATETTKESIRESTLKNSFSSQASLVEMGSNLSSNRIETYLFVY